MGNGLVGISETDIQEVVYPQASDQDEVSQKNPSQVNSDIAPDLDKSVVSTPSFSSSGDMEAAESQEKIEEALLEKQIIASVEKAIHNGIANIQRIIDEKQAEDHIRETQIDRLHSELQAYRADLVAKAIRPVLSSMIQLHDDWSKVLEAFSDQEPAQLNPERLLQIMNDFRDDVELALERHGVTTFRKLGDEFDPHRQKVVSVVATKQLEQNRKVAVRRRPGFEMGDMLLEKERVSVYVATTEQAT